MSQGVEHWDGPVWVWARSSVQPPQMPLGVEHSTVLRLAQLGPSFADLADTAAAMEGVDLVITCATAVAHLAGALGSPTWLLSTPPDSQWELERDTPPWYPSVRLFRQDNLGD